MKRVLGFILLLPMLSCNMLIDSDAGAKTKLDKDCSENSGEAVKILFIGNTYTSHNNLPKVFKDLACSLGKKTEIYAITETNYRFLNHSKDQGTLDLIDHAEWDFVILQNHGQVPSWKPVVVEKSSLPYAEDLANAIYARAADAEIIYLQTWGRLLGDEANCINYALVCDLAGHTQALADGYQMYADATDGQIAFVGNAFLKFYQEETTLFNPKDLWHADGAHPSFAGSYLAASVLYAKIFNESPLGAMPMELGKEKAQYLQQIAAQI